MDLTLMDFILSFENLSFSLPNMSSSYYHSCQYYNYKALPQQCGNRICCSILQHAHIVCNPGHKCACGVLGEIRDREVEDMPVQHSPNISNNPLAYITHEVRLSEERKAFNNRNNYDD